MVTVTIGSKPLAGFDQPIEMLKDCHRRIEHFLAVLKQVVERFGGDNLPDEGRRALEASLNYFANAAPRHTADEEHSLFPRLRRSGDPTACQAIEELDRLESDHRRADAYHARVEQIARRWLGDGRIDELDRAALADLLDELIAIYSAHIRLEEERIFALASGILKRAELNELGNEMRQRRIENANKIESRFDSRLRIV